MNRFSKKTAHTNLLLLLLIIMAFCSCTKNGDIKFLDLTECRITTFQSPATKGVITYNNLGNPVFIHVPATATGGLTNDSFRYDTKNRLVDFIRYYKTGGSFEFWDKYGYNNKNQIVRDTFYYFGHAVNGEPADEGGTIIYTYAYDAAGRLIKRDEGGFITTYNYDARGNLIHEGVDSYSYDTKKNVNRTNPIWQFLNKDYSKNNAISGSVKILSYNDNGYPIKLSVKNKSTDYPFYFLNYPFEDTVTIKYDCSCKFLPALKN